MILDFSRNEHYQVIEPITSQCENIINQLRLDFTPSDHLRIQLCQWLEATIPCFLITEQYFDGYTCISKMILREEDYLLFVLKYS